MDHQQEYEGVRVQEVPEPAVDNNHHEDCMLQVQVFPYKHFISLDQDNEIRLQNLDRNNSWSFKIQSTASKLFKVSPAVGVIRPLESTPVSVVVVVVNNTMALSPSSVNESCKFLVRRMKLQSGDDDHDLKSIKRLWKTIPSSSSFDYMIECYNKNDLLPSNDLMALLIKNKSKKPRDVLSLNELQTLAAAKDSVSAKVWKTWQLLAKEQHQQLKKNRRTGLRTSSVKKPSLEFTSACSSPATTPAAPLNNNNNSISCSSRISSSFATTENNNITSSNISATTENNIITSNSNNISSPRISSSNNSSTINECILALEKAILEAKQLEHNRFANFIESGNIALKLLRKETTTKTIATAVSSSSPVRQTKIQAACVLMPSSQRSMIKYCGNKVSCTSVSKLNSRVETREFFFTSNVIDTKQDYNNLIAPYLNNNNKGRTIFFYTNDKGRNEISTKVIGIAKKFKIVETLEFLSKNDIIQTRSTLLPTWKECDSIKAIVLENDVALVDLRSSGATSSNNNDGMLLGLKEFCIALKQRKYNFRSSAITLALRSNFKVPPLFITTITNCGDDNDDSCSVIRAMEFVQSFI